MAHWLGLVSSIIYVFPARNNDSAIEPYHIDYITIYADRFDKMTKSIYTLINI